MLALVGSFMVSYTRARAEGLGLECKVGWFERPERMRADHRRGAAQVFGAMSGALLLLALLSFATAAQRMVHVWKITRRAGSDQLGGLGLMGKVRVAIIGVGNCASSFVQGLHYYRNAKETDRIPGLMHVNLGGYHIRDVEIVAAIDIDKNKVGKDLARRSPGRTTPFSSPRCRRRASSCSAA